MADKKNLKTMLMRLKKQVTVLRRKEKISRNKLRAALVKARKMAKTYENKLEKKAKDTLVKVAAAEAAVYAKIATSIKNRAKKSKKPRVKRAGVAKKTMKRGKRKSR